MSTAQTLLMPGTIPGQSGRRFDDGLQQLLGLTSCAYSHVRVLRTVRKAGALAQADSSDYVDFAV